MSPHQGSIVYDHIRQARPEMVLEIGTAHGVSAAYMAAALDENGRGHVVTVDRADAPFRPAELLEKLGLADRVTLVRREDSSYNWFLKEQVARQSDEAGNCEPLYDFCYLDAAKNWTIDGLAIFLIEKLLKPGAWLLLDDLGLPLLPLAADLGRPPDMTVVELPDIEDPRHELRELLELRPLVVCNRHRDAYLDRLLDRRHHATSSFVVTARLAVSRGAAGRNIGS